MAYLGPGGFDARAEEPLKPYTPIPAGTYTAAITRSELKPTRAGDGEYLELSFELLEGEHSGRTLVRRLNLRNRRERVEQMARAELSAICRALRVLTPRDSEELHDIPLLVDVRVRRRGDTGELQSEIRGYRARGSPAAEAATEVEATENARDRAPWDG